MLYGGMSVQRPVQMAVLSWVCWVTDKSVNLSGSQVTHQLKGVWHREVLIEGKGLCHTLLAEPRDSQQVPYNNTEQVPTPIRRRLHTLKIKELHSHLASEPKANL